jgi:hypothetical protein
MSLWSQLTRFSSLLAARKVRDDDSKRAERSTTDQQASRARLVHEQADEIERSL